MKNFRKVFLQLNSNINEYYLTIYDYDKKVTQRINSRKKSFLICANSKILKIIAQPIAGEFSTTLYYTVNTCQNKVVFLDLNFKSKTVQNLTENIFFLTDANYGFNLNGALYFKSE